MFSHPSKVGLVTDAKAGGYQVWLLVVHVDEDLAVERVRYRVRVGGHGVPEEKVRERHRRLTTLIAQALPQADRAVLFDNSAPGTGHVTVASVDGGAVRWNTPASPRWAADLLAKAGLTH